MTFVVRGHRTPTDFSQFTPLLPGDQPDAPYTDQVTEVECGTRERAEALLYWYPDGEIVEKP